MYGWIGRGEKKEREGGSFGEGEGDVRVWVGREDI